MRTVFDYNIYTTSVKERINIAYYEWRVTLLHERDFIERLHLFFFWYTLNVDLFDYIRLIFKQ